MKKLLLIMFTALFTAGALSANEPFFSVQGKFRSKTGTSGLEHLRAYSMPMSIHMPGEKIDWDFTATPSYAYTGNINYWSTKVGSDYLTLHPLGAPIKHRLKSERYLFTPSLSIAPKDFFISSINLGMTPIGGDMAPMPTASVGIPLPFASLSLYNSSVSDSIISHLGIYDPYTDKKFGQVFKSGVALGHDFELDNNYFVSLVGHAAYLWGHNVHENHMLGIYYSAGKLFHAGDGGVRLGLRGQNRTYKHDLSGYRFGSGGYTSPKFELAIGPFASYNTALGKGYSVELMVHPYFLFREYSTARNYYLSMDRTGNTLQMDRELDGDSKKDNLKRLYVDYKIQLYKEISSKFGLNLYFGLENSNVDDDAQGGITLVYFFSSNKNWKIDKNMHSVMREHSTRI
ncbi:Cellulose synthase operon protein C C-terminus (BCSC_C) [Parelusimicrobium proximum]|uniref:cellulose synthase subunit BcsC-related outer membrane protein n=1 Tax=Parelusimicrobium proximum TaxID=3228953 RepID=UPI003D176232